MSNSANLARIDAMAERDTTEYGIIESAVMETARGRWFLREYARKNRQADTILILKAIEKLATRTQDLGHSIDTEHIRRELADMAQAIASTRNEIGSIRADIEQEIQPTTASCELDSIVSATEKATSEILEAAEQVQETAWTMREQDIDEQACEKLDALATDIYTACSFQDLTGQRTDKVIKVLHYLEERINKMAQIWGAQSWHEGQIISGPASEHKLSRGNSPETPATNNQNDIDTVLEDTAEAQKMLSSEPECPEISENVPDITEPQIAIWKAAEPAPQMETSEAEDEKSDEEEESSGNTYAGTTAAINMSSLDSNDMHTLFCF